MYIYAYIDNVESKNQFNTENSINSAMILLYFKDTHTKQYIHMF